MIFQVDDEHKEPSSSTIPARRAWRERYHWLGVMVMAAFAGFAPAPPPPQPPRDMVSQIAEDPDGLKLDPERHFLQNALDQDASGVDA